MAGEQFVTAFTNAAEGTNATTHTITLPAAGTFQAGDILIISAGLASGSSTLTADGIGMTAQAADDINTRSGHTGHTWVRTLTAAHAGTTVTFTSSSSLKIAVAAEIIRIPNLAVGTPPEILPANGTTASTFNAPAFTPNSLKVAVFTLAASHSTIVPTVWTPPSGVTLRTSRATAGATGRSSAAIADALTSGATLGTQWATFDDTATAVAATWSATTIVFTTAAPANEITHVAAFTNDSEDATDSVHTVTLPVVHNGDTLVLGASLASGTTLALTGAGLVQQISNRKSTRSGHALHVWVLPLQASHSETTITLTSGIDVRVQIVGEILRGTLDLSADGLAGAFTDVTGTTASTFNAPAFTPSTTRVGLMVVGGSSGANEPPTVWTPPTGTTLVGSQRSGGTTGRTAVAAARFLTRNASVGTTWTTDTAATWAAVTVTLSTVAVTPAPVDTRQRVFVKMADGSVRRGSIAGIYRNGVKVATRINAVSRGTSNPVTPTPDPTPGQVASEGMWMDASPIQKPMKYPNKIVGAHYFTPYPIKVSNVAVDEWVTNFLDPNQAGYETLGGLSRNRSEDRDVYPGVTQTQSWALDMEQEIGWAMESGIDCFYVDILGASGRNYDLAGILIDTAHRLNNGFRVIPMLDINGATAIAGVATAAAGIARYAGKNGSHYLPDGRFLVTIFRTEGRPASFYDELEAALRVDYGLNVAFIGVFLSYSQTNINTYTKVGGVSTGAKKPYWYGVGSWGIGGDPAAIKAASNQQALASSNGLIFLGPVSGQNVRHTRSLVFDEGANTEGIRAAWEKAIADNYDMVQIVTWNDYSEGGDVQPSQGKGHVPTDLAAWYTHRRKTGAYPAILRDAVIVSHRAQFVGVNSTAEISGSTQTEFTAQRVLPTRTTARDMVEVLTFLTEAATVNVAVGANTYTYTAPKGMSGKLYPLAVAGIGGINVQVVRGGVTVVNHASPFQVNQIPKVEDKTYKMSGSNRVLTGVKKQRDPTVNYPG